MLRLYSNENFPLPVVQELRKLGHDVLTSYEAKNADLSLPDIEVLRFAIGQNRAVITLNRRHFIRLHTAVQNHSGIIVCTFDENFERQAQRIHAAISLHNDLSGKLIRVNRETAPG